MSELQDKESQHGLLETMPESEAQLCVLRAVLGTTNCWPGSLKVIWSYSSSSFVRPPAYRSPDCESERWEEKGLLIFQGQDHVGPVHLGTCAAGEVLFSGVVRWTSPTICS